MILLCREDYTKGMTSVRDIQKGYIELLESYINPLGKEALNDHIYSGDRFGSMPYLSDVLLAYYEPLGKDITDYWKQYAKEIRKSLAESNNLKVCYSGDISPSDASMLTNKLGMYVDTILIPDPVLNITQQLAPVSDRNFYLRSVVRHAINMVKIKPLLDADSEFPITAVYPSTKIFNRDFVEKIRDAASEDARVYINQTFNLKLKKSDDAFEIMQSFKKPEDIIALVKNESNLIPDWALPSVQEGIKNFYDGGKQMYIKEFANRPAGEAIYMYILGRLMSFHDHFENCKEFAAEPLYDSPNSWKMFTWYLDACFPEGNLLTNEGLVANSIGIDNPKWIGNLPVDALVEARKRGELSEIRATLTKNINRIKFTRVEDLEGVTAQVQENLKNEFDEHQRKIKDIEKRFKNNFYLKSPVTVVGELLGYIPDPHIQAASALISLPFTLLGLVDIYRSSNKILEEDRAERGRLIGLMYDSEK